MHDGMRWGLALACAAIAGAAIGEELAVGQIDIRLAGMDCSH